MFDECVQINGERVVVVTVPGRGRGAESAPVVGDHPVAVVDQCGHLLLPGAAGQRPTVDEDHRLSGAAVLVVKLDRLPFPSLTVRRAIEWFLSNPL